MKRNIVNRITAAALVLSFAAAAAACGANRTDSSSATPDAASKKDNGSLHTIYFRDSAKSGKVVADFSNSAPGKSESVEMVRCGEDGGAYTFSCEGNTAAYNVVRFACDGKNTKKIAFNPCVSGWYRSNDSLVPYTQGEDAAYVAHYEPVSFDYKGYEKKVYVWTPDDYDAGSDDKYATIYVLDGQDEVNSQNDAARTDDALYIPEQVRSMTAATGYKAIVVAVATYGDMGEYVRDDELVPDIGDIAEEEYNSVTKKMGGDFARFMAETLVPYVRQHYNVYTDALHTSVTGASLGALESFYITMEYPETFGTAGVQSPSFWVYNDAVWRKYLGEKDFSKNTPFIYLYTGPEGGDTDPHVTEMYNRLLDMGYPADRTALHFNEKGAHQPSYWRNYFSEYLSAMVLQRLEPLQGK